jgi:hypothetical protein
LEGRGFLKAKGADALDRRPKLARALAVVRKTRGAVLVAKLDRLSRDVAFVSGLMTPEEGQAVAAVLEGWRRAVETVQIEERLAALERAARTKAR